MKKLLLFFIQHKSLTIITAVMITPLLLNYSLFSWHLPSINGHLADWMDFLSNYLGAIIGGLVAYFVAKIQINQMTIQDIENNRSFFSANEFYYTLDSLCCNQVDELRKIRGKLLLTDDFKNLENDKNRLNRLMECRDYNLKGSPNQCIRCYSLIIIGNNDAIINCSIKITIGDGGDFKNVKYIKSWIDCVEKNEELIIPLYSQDLNLLRPFTKGVEITYQTLKNETICFSQSEKGKKILYTTIKDNTVKKRNNVIMVAKSSSVNWKYIYKKHS